MRTAIRRLLIIAACVVGIGFPVLCWLASSRLICPSRRPLQDYHQEILANAREHGMQIRSFTVNAGEWKGTPCLLCEPSTEPGTAEKGNKLRAQLTAEHVALKPWGEIIGHDQQVFRECIPARHENNQLVASGVSVTMINEPARQP